MSLIDIKQHMMKVKMATLSSLCILFNRDADTLRFLLQHWMRKGCIKQCVKNSDCGSRCFKCPSGSTEIYEWVDGVTGIAIT
jgi:putative ferrous iron transport protein C